MNSCMSGNHMKSKFSRRAMLDKMCVGFGGFAFNSILANPSFGSQVNDFPNLKPRAKRIIFLFTVIIQFNGEIKLYDDYC